MLVSSYTVAVSRSVCLPKSRLQWTFISIPGVWQKRTMYSFTYCTTIENMLSAQGSWHVSWGENGNSPLFSEAHLRGQLQDDFDALHNSLRFSPDQNHTVGGMRAALLEELDCGLGVLEVTQQRFLAADLPRTRTSAATPQSNLEMWIYERCSWQVGRLMPNTDVS